jgi:hypothetical protein
VQKNTSTVDEAENDHNIDDALQARALGPKEQLKLSKEIQALIKRLKQYGNSVPGTPLYIQFHRTLLLAKIANPYVLQVGTLQWFATSAPSDILNDRMHISSSFPSCGFPDRAALWDAICENERSQAAQITTRMREHPALQCRFFKWKQDTIWSVFLNPKLEAKYKGVLHILSDFFRRIEFQGRGTPHEHSLLHVSREGIHRTIYERCYGGVEPIPQKGFVEKEDISKAHYANNDAAKERVESVVDDVVTTNLEARMPSDETNLTPRPSKSCISDAQRKRCLTCEDCIALAQRKVSRRRETPARKGEMSNWYSSRRSYFTRREEYEEHKHRGGTEQSQRDAFGRAIEFDYSRITQAQVDEAKTNSDLREELVDIWRRRRTFDDLWDLDEEGDILKAPQFPSAHESAHRELNNMVGELWEDAVSTRYRNWQIANQMHACRPTCKKYDRHPNPLERKCRFDFPHKTVRSKAEIVVDRDRKCRVRMRVLPARNNAHLNYSYVDAGLPLFHGGNMDVQFTANDVGAGEYTCSYAAKPEAPDTDVFLKLISRKFADLNAACDTSDKERLKAVGNSLLTATSVGATQVMWTLLRFPFIQTSREYLNINPLDRANVTRVITQTKTPKDDAEDIGAEDDGDGVDDTPLGTKGDGTSNICDKEEEEAADEEEEENDAEEKRVYSYSPGSQFGKRHAYGRLVLEMEKIFKEDEDESRENDVPRRFKRPHEFSPKDPNRDDAMSFFNLFTFFNVAVLTPKMVTKLENEDKIGEKLLCTPLAIDAKGWLKWAHGVVDGNAREASSLRIRKRKRSRSGVLDEADSADEAYEAEGEVHADNNVDDDFGMDDEEHVEINAGDLQRKGNSKSKTITFIIRSRNPDDDDAEPTLRFNLRKIPRVINMSPHCPFNAQNERSCFAFLLMYVPWPALSGDDAEDPRALPEKLICGDTGSSIRRVKLLEIRQKMLEDLEPDAVDSDDNVTPSGVNENDAPTEEDGEDNDGVVRGDLEEVMEEDGVRIPRHVRALVQAQVRQKEILENHGTPLPDGCCDGIVPPDDLEEIEEEDFSGPNDDFDPSLVGDCPKEDPVERGNRKGVYKVTPSNRIYYGQWIKNACSANTSRSNKDNCIDANDCINQARYAAKELVDIEDKEHKKEELASLLAHFKDGQRGAFAAIRSHLEGDGQLRMFITGGGGVGKSHVIKAAKRFGRLHFGKTESSLGSVVVVAPTGNAAFNAEGVTWQSALKKGLGKPITPQTAKFNEKVIDQLKGKLGGLKFLIFDEVSMLSLNDLYEIHIRLCHAKGTDHTDLDRPFGGIHVLFVGDFFQLPPVAASGGALYAEENFIPITGARREGFKLWRTVILNKSASTFIFIKTIYLSFSPKQRYKNRSPLS